MANQGVHKKNEERLPIPKGRHIIADMTRKFTRRYFLRLMLGSTATVGLSALGGTYYSALVEPHWLALEHVDVPLRGLPVELNGFTIVQLSDLHRGSVMAQEDIAQAVEVALQQQVDLVVLTGDYVSGSAQYALSCAETLAPLAAHAEALACLGNHDHWTDADIVADALAQAGPTVLRNAAQEVADGLWVAAVDDVWERHADLDKALDRVPAGATIVLLAHEPDYADEVAADGRVSLQISGHSHGGQVRFPLLRPPALPYLGTKYYAGRYRVDQMWLYVNRGVGMINPAVRFNCRPEVTILKLQAPTA
jgi:predicted MPP superfamily phosphohydrolase